MRYTIRCGIAAAVIVTTLAACQSPPYSGRVHFVERSLAARNDCVPATSTRRALAVAPAITIHPRRLKSAVGITIDAGPASVDGADAEPAAPTLQPGRLLTGEVAHHDPITQQVVTVWTEHLHANRRMALTQPLYATFRANGKEPPAVTPDQMACLTPVKPAALNMAAAR